MDKLNVLEAVKCQPRYKASPTRVSSGGDYDSDDRRQKMERLNMARKVGQIIARGEHKWLIRFYLSRDHETEKRKYHNHRFTAGSCTSQRSAPASSSAAGIVVCSQRLQEVDQILHLLGSESNLEALVIEVDDLGKIRR